MAALSADGKTLAVTTRKRLVRVWDVNTSKEKHRLGEFQGQVTALVISPDGRQVAAAADDGAVQVWSAVTGKQLFQPDAKKTRAPAYDSMGKLLATGGEYGTVWLWDTATGKRLVSGSGDTTALVWDAARLRAAVPQASPAKAKEPK
jgi:WD40 repeat protein